MKKICVYTCLTGNYDNLHEIEVKDNKVDFICYTNNKNLKSNTWKIIYVEDNELNDHQLSRKIKMIGTEYIDSKYDISVWQDASVIWKKEPSKFVEKYLKGDFSAFIHNERSSVIDEAYEVIRLRRDSKKNVLKHLEFLKKEGFPDNLGLFEMTVFIKRHNNQIVKDTMNIWFETYLKNTKRDQLSFMYAVWKTNLKVHPINMNVWNNQWVEHIKHNFKENVTECRINFGDYYSNDDYRYSQDLKYKIKDNVYSISTTIPVDTNVIEIEATDVPCIKFSDVKFNCKYDTLQIFNTIQYDKYNIFYNNKGIIRLNGNFKEQKEFKFSIRLEKFNDYEKYNLIDRLSTDLIASTENIEVLNKHVYDLNINLYKARHPIRWLLKKILRKMKIIKD